MNGSRSADSLEGGRSLVRSGSAILLLSLLTLGLALLTQIGLAAFLGTSREMDVFLVAVSLPAFLNSVSMFAQVAAFVPLFQSQTGSGSADFFTRIFAAVAIVSAGLTLIVILTAYGLVRLIAPGFDESSTRLAAQLLQIMAVASGFDILRGVLTARSFSRERFLLPQFVPILNHFLLLFTVIFILRPAGLTSLAWAWTAGSCLMFLPLFLVSLRRDGWSLRPGTAPLRSAWNLLSPALIIAVIQQTAPLFDRLVASWLQTGSISYLGYGSKILEVLIRTLPMAIGVVSFPLMSEQANEKSYEALSRLAKSGLRAILLGVVPLAVFLWCHRRTLIVLLFQRGNFDAAASQGVADVLGWYAIAFLPASVAYLLTNLGFALRKHWAVASLALLGSGITLALDIVLARVWGAQGIAASYLLVAGLTALVFVAWFERSLHISLPFRDPGWIVRLAAAALVFLLIQLLGARLLPPPPENILTTAGVLFLSGLAGATAYFVILSLSGMPEIEWIKRRVRERILRRTDGD